MCVFLCRCVAMMTMSARVCMWLLTAVVGVCASRVAQHVHEMRLLHGMVEHGQLCSKWVGRFFDGFNLRVQRRHVILAWRL